MVRLATGVISLAARVLAPVIRRVRVEGLSMVPTYAPGEYLWAVRRVVIPRYLRVGDVVLCPDPDNPQRELLKRVDDVRWAVVNYDVVLAGDNREASRDSRDFGPVPVRQVKWVVWPHRRPFDIDRTPPTL